MGEARIPFISEQRIELHIPVHPTLEHRLSGRALIGETAFLRHPFRRAIPIGDDKLHPVNFRALQEVIRE